MEFTVVDVWVGNFSSETDLAAYFLEDHSSENDSEPISGFAAGQQQPFYDHDFVERHFFEVTDDLSKVLDLCSFGRSYSDVVVEVGRTRHIPPVNTAIIAFDNKIRHPRSVVSEGCELFYLGKFDCDPMA